MSGSATNFLYEANCRLKAFSDDDGRAPYLPPRLDITLTWRQFVDNRCIVAKIKPLPVFALSCVLIELVNIAFRNSGCD